MPETLNAAELSALVARVFQPTPEDRLLGIMVDLPDEKVPDDAAWAARRRIAAWAGWSRDALCDERRLGDPAVRKALRAPFPPGFLQAIAHLQHPALRHALYRKISA